MKYEITRGAYTQPVRCVLYGTEGVGKTTFASQWPGAVFIDIEDGSGHYDVARFPRPAMWSAIVEEVRAAATMPEVGTLVLDTADAAEALCIESVCAEKKVQSIEGIPYGKGYTYVAEKFRELLVALDGCILAGKHVVVIAHAQIKKFEQPDELGAYDRWELKLSKKVAPILKEWCDLLLFANYKTDTMKDENGKYRVTGGKRRVMYASHTAAYDAKNRLGLPDEMPFEFASMAGSVGKFDTAVAEAASPMPQIEFEEVTPLEFVQLRELMSAYGVSDRELREVVGNNPNHPYTADTQIGDYPIEFVRDVLLPHWEAIVATINQQVPFN